jgi:hypothetical protein
MFFNKNYLSEKTYTIWHSYFLRVELMQLLQKTTGHQDKSLAAG